MSYERLQQALDIIETEKSVSAGRIRAAIIEEHQRRCHLRGDNSEITISYVVSHVPKVLSVKPYHGFIGDLDGDLIAEFDGIHPVFIQSKTSETEAVRYISKIKRRWAKGLQYRVAALSYDSSFDEIAASFIDQVNFLEGRRYIKAFKFTQEKP